MFERDSPRYTKENACELTRTTYVRADEYLVRRYTDAPIFLVLNIYSIHIGGRGVAKDEDPSVPLEPLR